MDELSTAAVVDFPLRGEWRALNTPAARVPSHGTDFFAQRYAIDFVQMDATGIWYYPGGGPQLLRHITIGLGASHFFCWGQPVHSAFAGRVLAARDGWPDRARVQLGWELLRATVAPPSGIAPGDYRPLAGNYVLVEGAEGVALYAHLRRGSVRITTGQRLAAGDVLGAVGNSGNSTMPHLHFHLMDGPDALTARGLPCAFRGYARWTGAGWEAVAHGVPGRLERIRAV
jgi:hypothetical protein